MSNVVRFPFLHKRPHLIPLRAPAPIELAPNDRAFQEAIRDQSAERRALLAARRNRFMPDFSRFWERFHGVTDCGAPTGSPIDE